MSTEVRIPLRPELFEVERATYRQNSVERVSYTLSELGRKLAGVEESIQQKVHRRLNPSYKIVHNDEGVFLETREHGYARGLIKRMLEWPVYAVVEGSSEGDIVNSLRGCKKGFLRTTSVKKKWLRLDFIHFEAMADAALFRLGLKSGVSNVYRVKEGPREEVTADELAESTD